VHQNLSGVEEADFAVWLGLFEDTVSDLAPSPDVTSYFMERAQRIAESLKLAMFSLPSLKRSPSV
jgi:hemoglobin